MKKTKQKLVMGDEISVVWLDTVGDNHSWTHAEDYSFKNMLKSTEMKTSGFFIKHEEGFVFIAQSYRVVDQAFNRVMAIPDTCLVGLKKRK